MVGSPSKPKWVLGTTRSRAELHMVIHLHPKGPQNEHESREWWTAARELCQQRKNGGKGLGLDVKLRVPTWYPQRAAEPGAPFICRYHNYAFIGCKKTVRCPFDHDHCHFCFQLGHIARDCEGFNLTLTLQASKSPSDDIPEGVAMAIPPPQPLHAPVPAPVVA